MKNSEQDAQLSPAVITEIATEVARRISSDLPHQTVWMSPDEAAQYLRLSRRGLEQMRARAAGPRYSKVGRIVRYKRVDLDRWLDGNCGGGVEPTLKVC